MRVGKPPAGSKLDYFVDIEPEDRGDTPFPNKYNAVQQKISGLNILFMWYRCHCNYGIGFGLMVFFVTVLSVAGFVMQLFAIVLASRAGNETQNCRELTNWLLVYGVLGLCTTFVQALHYFTVRNFNPIRKALYIVYALTGAVVVGWTIYGSILILKPNYKDIYKQCWYSSDVGQFIVNFTYFLIIYLWTNIAAYALLISGMIHWGS